MALTKATYSMIQGAPANVLDFGAVGDGAANDTAAIQDAIDSLTDGGTLYLPEGTYKVDTLLFPNQFTAMKFIGAGMDATVLQMNDPTKPVIAMTPSALIRNIGSVFSDFSVKAHPTSNLADPTQIAIDAKGFDQVLFQRIKYQSNGTGSVGAMFRTSSAVNLTYTQVFDSITIQEQRGPHTVFKTDDGGLGALYNTNVIEIKNGWFYANTDMYAICDMSKCTSYSIHNNEFETSGDYAIILGNQGLIEDNWFELQAIAPILFQTTGSVTSSSNTFISNYFSGFGGAIPIPNDCNGTVFINNSGGNYTFTPANATVAPLVIGGPFAGVPTLTKTFGPAGTLTLSEAFQISKFDGTWRFLYTFLPSTALTNYGFTMAPPTGYGITKLIVGAYDGTNGTPYTYAVGHPGNTFLVNAPNTNLISIFVLATMQ